MKNKLYIIILTALLAVPVVSCNREPSVPPEPKVDHISIANLRTQFDGTKDTITLDTSIYIRGVITLSPELSNIPSAIAYIQDSTAAICLTALSTETNTFAMDSKVKIYLKGLKMTRYNGLLQILDISTSSMVRVLSVVGESVKPDTVTVAQLLSGAYESKYVYLKSVQFDSPGTFSGSQSLTDCYSTIPVYTRSDASFASTALPTGRGSLKGISSIYNSQQILLRDPSELIMTGARCGTSGITYLTESFNSLVRYSDVSSLPGWLTFPETGNKTWNANYKTTATSDLWVQATASGSAQASVKTWMITPALDLTNATNPYITFKSARGYDNGATLQLYASTDYDGSDTPWTFTWVPLTFTLPASNQTGYSSFTSSGNIDLHSFAGSTVHIAWVYTGGDPGLTTRWEVDNVTIGEL